MHVISRALAQAEAVKLKHKAEDMSSYLLKQADKITLGLVGAACLAALGDAYVKRAASVEGGQKVVDAMKTEKERLKTEKSQSSSMQSHQVLNNTWDAHAWLPICCFAPKSAMRQTTSLPFLIKCSLLSTISSEADALFSFLRRSICLPNRQSQR